MPATQVSPSLRRRLSDDARELLRSALAADEEVNVRDLTLSERLQNFRGQIRLEVPATGWSLTLRLMVANTCYLVRYAVESINAEVCVCNRAGAVTSWITLEDGSNVQLRSFVSSQCSPAEECEQIAALVEAIDSLDLFDVFRGCLLARPVPQSPPTSALGYRPRNEIYQATTDRNSYLYVFDGATGRPLSVTQSVLYDVEGAVNTTSFGVYQRLQILVDEYLRYEGTIAVPAGVKSDVELMIDTAMTCFSQWSYDSQQLVMNIFDLMDRDRDGYVTSQDIGDQLVAAGHTEDQARAIVTEMGRLLCDSADPADEFGFYRFCGFWMTMLVEGYRLTDPANEEQLVKALQSLFVVV